jgi:hypothetical protein
VYMKKGNANLTTVALVVCGLMVAIFGGSCGGPTGSDDNPELAAMPDTLDFGESRDSLPLTIDNAGTGVLNWQTQVPSEGWVSVNQANGSVVNTPITVDVRLDREKAPVGQQQVKLVVTGGGGQREVIVKAIIQDRSPVLKVEPVNLDFGETSSSQLITVSNTGGGTLHWSIAAPSEGWIELSQREGNTTGEAARIDVRIDREKAPAGRQQVTLVVTGDGGARQEVGLVAMILRPTLVVTPTELHFDTGAQSKSLVIANEGTGALNWSAEAPESWLQVDPTSGRTLTQASTVIVSVDRSRVAENGTYTSEVVVTSDGGTLVIPVSMVAEGMVAPSELRVSPLSLAFGETSNRKTLGISNAGTGGMTWQARAPQEWISTTPDSGTVAGGEAAIQVIVEVDRSQLSPGEHRGSVDVISTGGSATIPITVSVPAPVIALNIRNLDFRTDLRVLSLEIANTGTGELKWEFGEELDWLEIKPSEGATGQVTTSVELSVQRQGLAVGLYEGKVKLTSNSTSESSIEVRVKIEVREQPELAVQPDSLDFKEELSELELEVVNANNGTLTWQAKVEEDWIDLTRTGGELGLQEKESIKVTVDRQGLTSGIYQTQVEFTSNGGEQKIPVRMEVPQAPRLVVDSQSLDLSASGVTENLTLRNTGMGRLTWKVDEEIGWCTVQPDQGTTLGEVDTLAFTVNRAGLAPGSYTGMVTVSSDGGAQEVAVEMQVAEEPILGVSADSLEFGNEGETLTLTVSNQGNASLIWSLEIADGWVQVSPRSGELAPGENSEVQVRLVREGLALGDHQTVLALDSNGGKREIRMDARVEAALLTVSKEELNFGDKLSRITVTLGNEGNVQLEWTAVEAVEWLELSATGGIIESGDVQEAEVVIGRADLSPGEYTGEVAIKSNDKRGPVALVVRVFVPENNAPIANAGTDQKVEVGDVVTLDGSTSSDPDGDKLAFHWIAPTGIVLNSSSVAHPQFTAAAEGIYRFVLVVNDGQADSEPDEVLITVVATRPTIGEIVIDVPIPPDEPEGDAFSGTSAKKDTIFYEDFSSIEEGGVPSGWLRIEHVLVRSSGNEKLLTPFEPGDNEIVIPNITFPPNFRIEWYCRYQGNPFHFYITVGNVTAGMNSWSKEIKINDSIESITGIENRMILMSLEKNDTVFRLFVDGSEIVLTRVTDFEDATSIILNFGPYPFQLYKISVMALP